MNRYSVKKGQHAFTPSVSMNIRRRPGRLGWFVRFSDSCRYTLPGADQKDWNKLAGLSFCLTTNHQNSAMGSWRYNPATGLFELGYYLHVSGTRVMDQEEELQIGVGHTVALWLEIDWKSRIVKVLYELEPGGTQYGYAQQFKSMGFLGLTREIGTWFGGNNAAPHDMYLAKSPILRWTEDGPDWSQVAEN